MNQKNIQVIQQKARGKKENIGDEQYEGKQKYYIQKIGEPKGRYGGLSK